MSAATRFDLSRATSRHQAEPVDLETPIHRPENQPADLSQPLCLLQAVRNVTSSRVQVIARAQEFFSPNRGTRDPATVAASCARRRTRAADVRRRDDRKLASPRIGVDRGHGRFADSDAGVLQLRVANSRNDGLVWLRFVCLGLAN